MRITTLTLCGLVGLFGLAQLRRVDIGNPVVEGSLNPPPAVEKILARCCYDCHSNRTNWPWYSHVAPLSWIAAHDVNRGRQELNFSQWQSYFPATRRRKLKWMGRAVADLAMPPWEYKLIHPGARLSDHERAALIEWIDSELSAPNAPPGGEITR